ncbi:CPBP family intramembrane glutamic endopeptidase [Occallatibacter riparius]|uniref:CPBP family intramembrane metalloprotease n=1 Tax=Occallatibacter riparius TaxID=1002689 RepID=A0A9J7BHH5_9BACT|nr:type II CAAX endopeptidase family protein [Occallatibacter riparius]UWZ82412.1 CPBP family intramembrane metalloprotease [Occallatibacter riparius]
MGQKPGIRTPKNRVAIFLITVTALTIAVSTLDKRGVFGHAGSLAYMWCPGVAALLASAITARSLKAIGWTTKLKWLGVGWLIPISYATFAYGSVWLTGLGGLPKDTFMPRARLTLGMPGQPEWLVIAAALGFICILSVLPSMIASLGEEIGWRGFLVPELSRWLGPQAAVVASGIVWALWHLPAIVWGGYGGEGTPKTYQVACFTAMVILSAIVMGWLRLKSGSIWPTAIAHATHNAAIQMFFDAITARRAYTAYFIGEFGCALLLPLAVMAWYCVRDLRHTELKVDTENPALTPAATLADAR